MEETELELKLREAAEQQKGRILKPLISFDTFGTVVDLGFEEVNSAFINLLKKEPGKIGYSAEQAQEMIALYGANKKDPKYLRESGRGKKAMVEKGILQARFFPDSLDFFVQAAERNIELATTSKGGIEFIETVYNTKMPETINVGEKEYTVHGDFLRNENGLHIYSTSSEEFTCKDKTDARCYYEFVIKMLRGGRQVLSYTSDDIKEVEATRGCSEMLKRSRVQAFKDGIVPIHIPVEPHKNQEKVTKYDNGIYVVGDLPIVVKLSLVPQMRIEL